MFSEKATTFCEISTLLLSVCTVDKKRRRFRKILWSSQNIRPLIENSVHCILDFFNAFPIIQKKICEIAMCTAVITQKLFICKVEKMDLSGNTAVLELLAQTISYCVSVECM